MEATKLSKTTSSVAAAVHVSETPDLLQLKESEDRASLIKPSITSFIQPKLTVSPPDDQYEREADDMSERVMRMEDEEEHVQPKLFSSGIQRKCAQCEEEMQVQTKTANHFVHRKCEQCEQEEEDLVQRSESSNDPASNEAPSIVQEALSSGGHPMDVQTQSFMESRFGYDFTGVKIHTGSLASESAQSINALAYTSGNSIVFNEGQYAPGTDSGNRLLAHELTHVVQQNPALQKKTITTVSDLNRSPENIIRRSLTFAPDPRPKGSLIHSTVLPMFVKSNSDLFIEVSIPGAKKDDVDKGSKGFADFYKVDATGGQSRTIGIRFDGEPDFLTSSGKKLQWGGGKYSHNSQAAPKGGKHTPRIRELDNAPEKIEIGDLKPGGSGEVSLGEGQINDYKSGIKNTAKDVNSFIASNQKEHDGTTKKSWDPTPVNMNTLTIPDKLDYPTGQGISRGKLALYGGESKKPILDDTGLVGSMFVYKDATGIWSYEWIPDDIPVSTGNSLVNSVLDRLNNQVIPAISASKPGAVAGKRISSASLSGTKVNKKHEKPIQRTAKTFNASDWQKKQFDPWEADAKKFLGDDKEVGKARVAEGVLDVNKRIGNKLKIPTEVKERGKGLDKIKHWKNFGKAYGFLREKFDFVYVKIKGVVDNVKAKVKKLAKTSAGSAFGNWVKAVAKVIFKIFKLVGSWVVQQTVDKLMTSFQEGITNNINKLIEKFTPEEAEKKLAEFEEIKKKYQTILDQSEDDIIKFFFGDKIELFEKLDKWESIANTVSTIVDIVKWGIRIIACASPPALGCLWNLVVSAIEALFARLIQTCWFTKKAVEPVIEHVSAVNEFPNTLATEVVKAANNFIPLPGGMEPLFAPIPKADTGQFKFECGESGDGGSGQISGDRDAILDLAEEIGDEKMLAFVEMAKSKGAGPWVLLTKERIEALKEGLSQVSAEELKKLAQDPNAKTPVALEAFLKDIKEYTKQEKDTIKKWKEQSIASGDGKKESKGSKDGKDGTAAPLPDNVKDPLYGNPPGKIEGSVSSFHAAGYTGAEIKDPKDFPKPINIILRSDIVDGGKVYTVVVQEIEVKVSAVDDTFIHLENQKDFSVYYNGDDFVYYKKGTIFKVKKENMIYG